MYRLTKSEKETIALTNESAGSWEVSTYNATLKRRFREFAKEHPECCRLTSSTEDGCEVYTIEKGRLSFRLTAPYSDERLKMLRKTKLNSVQS